MTARKEAIEAHYAANWLGQFVEKRWTLGPMAAAFPEFCVVEFGPTPRRSLWTYATCGMSIGHSPIELHLFSRTQSDSLVELLTAIAHYNVTGAPIRLGDTVDFGRPWLPKATCQFGLISLPYLDGPRLENLQVNEIAIRVLWLIPITGDEREYKKLNGAEALEAKFESAQFDYADSSRQSVLSGGIG